MVGRVQQQLLVKQLQEVADCFTQPGVSHVVRLQKCTQLRSCISSVESICVELGAAKTAQNKAQSQAGKIEQLQRQLDQATAQLSQPCSGPAAVQSPQGTSAEAQRAAARVAELEKHLKQRTDELERTAYALERAEAAAKKNRSADSSAPKSLAPQPTHLVRELQRQVAALTQQVDQKSEDLETVRAQLTTCQKQLSQSRDLYGRLKSNQEAEAERHAFEMDQLRARVQQLDRAAKGAAGLPATPLSAAPVSQLTPRPGPPAQVLTPLGTPRALPMTLEGPVPFLLPETGLPAQPQGHVSPAKEADESHDAARYRRQLTIERQEHGRTRAERDDARSMLEHKSSELRRTQVILNGTKNELETATTTAADLQKELDHNSQQAAQLERELHITKDRLAWKESQLKELHKRASLDAGTSIFMAGNNRNASMPAHEFILAEREREVQKLNEERLALLEQMDKLRKNNSALSRNLRNSTKHGGMLQDKIKTILGRESNLHLKNEKLIKALEAAGAPIPHGTSLSPEILEEYEYDHTEYGQDSAPGKMDLDELLLTPAPSGSLSGFDFSDPIFLGKGKRNSDLSLEEEVETSRAIASEFAALQEDTEATMETLRRVNKQLGQTQDELADAVTDIEARDEAVKAMHGEKLVVLAMLLGKMGTVRNLMAQLEEMQRALHEKADSVGPEVQGQLAEATERLRTTDEVIQALQQQLADAELELGDVYQERDSLVDHASEMTRDLEQRRQELAELREQVKSLLSELQNMVEENIDLRKTVEMAVGEKVLVQAMLLGWLGKLRETAQKLAAAQAALRQSSMEHGLIAEAAAELRAQPLVSDRITTIADVNIHFPEGVSVQSKDVGATIKAAAGAVAAVSAELESALDERGHLSAEVDELKCERLALEDRVGELTDALTAANQGAALLEAQLLATSEEHEEIRQALSSERVSKAQDHALLDAWKFERDGAVGEASSLRADLDAAAEDLLRREEAVEELANRLATAQGEKALSQAMLLGWLDLLRRSRGQLRATSQHLEAAGAEGTRLRNLSVCYHKALCEAAAQMAGAVPSDFYGLEGQELADAVTADVAALVANYKALKAQCDAMEAELSDGQCMLSEFEAKLASARGMASILAAYRAGLEDVHGDVLAAEAAPDLGKGDQSTELERTTTPRAPLSGVLDDKTIELREHLDAWLASQPLFPVSAGVDANFDPDVQEVSGNISTAAQYANKVRDALSSLLSEREAQADALKEQLEAISLELRPLQVYRDALRQIHEDVLASTEDTVQDADLSSSGPDISGDLNASTGALGMANNIRNDIEYALQVRDDVTVALEEKKALRDTLAEQSAALLEAQAEAESLLQQLEVQAINLNEAEVAYKRLDSRVAELEVALQASTDSLGKKEAQLEVMETECMELQGANMELEERLTDATQDLQVESARASAYRDALKQVLSDAVRCSDRDLTIDDVHSSYADCAQTASGSMSPLSAAIGPLVRDELEMAALLRGRLSELEQRLATVEAAKSAALADADRLHGELEAAVARVAELLLYEAALSEVQKELEADGATLHEGTIEGDTLWPSGNGVRGAGKMASIGLGNAVDVQAVMLEEAPPGTAAINNDPVTLVRNKLNDKRDLEAEVLRGKPYVQLASDIAAMIQERKEPSERISLTGLEPGEECASVRGLVAAELADADQLRIMLDELQPYRKAVEGIHAAAADSEVAVFGARLFEPTPQGALDLFETSLATNKSLGPLNTLPENVLSLLLKPGPGPAARSEDRRDAVLGAVQAEVEACVKLKEELADSLAEHDDLAQRAAKLHSDAAADWMDLTLQVRNADSLASRLRKQLSDADAGANEARRATDMFQAERNRLASDLDALSHQAALHTETSAAGKRDLTTKLAVAVEQLASAETALSAKSDEAMAAEARRKEAQDKLDNVIHELKSAESEAVILGQQVQDYVRQMDTVASRLADEKRSNSDMRLEKNSLESSLARTTSEMQAALCTAVQRGDALCAELEEQTHELNEATQAVALLRQQVGKLEVAEARLEAELCDLREGSDDAKRRLGADLSAALARADGASSEADRIRQELAATRTELVGVRERMESLNERLDEKAREYADACERARTLELELGVVNMKLLDAEQQASGLEADARARDLELHQAQTRSEQLLGDLELARRDLQESVCRAEDLGREVARLKGESSACAAELDRTQLAKADLEDELNNQRNALAVADRRHTDLGKDLAAALSQVRELQAQRTSLQQSLEKSDVAFSKVTGGMSDLQTRLSEAQQAVASAEREKASLSQQLERTARQMRDAVDHANEKAERAKREIFQQAAAVARLNAEVAEADAKSRVLDGKLRATERQLMTAEGATKDLEAEVQSLKADLDGLRSDSESQRRCLEDDVARAIKEKKFAEATASALQTDLHTARNDLHSLKDASSLLQKSLDAKAAESHKLTRRAADLEAELSILKGQLGTAQSEAGAKALELTEFQQQINQLGRELEDARSSLKKTRENNEGLKAQLITEQQLRSAAEHQQQDATRKQSLAEGQVAMLSAEEADLRMKLRDHEAELQRAMTNASRLEAANHESGSTIAAMEHERNSLAQDLDITTQHMQSTVDSATERSKKLVGELNHHTRLLQQAASDISSAKADKQSLEDSHRGLERDLEAALDSARDHEMSSRALVAELDALRSSMEASQSRLNSDLSRANLATADAEADARHLKARLSQAQTSEAKLRELLDAQKQDLVTARETVTSLERDVEKAKSTASDQEGLLHALRSELQSIRSAAERQRGQLEDELERATQAKDMAVAGGKRLQDALNTANAEMAQLFEAAGRLQISLDNKADDWKQACSHAESLERDLRDISDQLDHSHRRENGLKNNLSTQASELSSTKAQVVQLSKDLDDARSVLQAAQIYAANLANKIDSLNSSVSDSNDRETVLQGELTSAMADLNVAQRSNDALKLELERQHEAKAAAASTQSELSRELSVAQAEALSLRDQQRELTESLYGRDMDLKDAKAATSQMEAGKRQAEQTTAAVERERDSLARDLERTAKKMQDDIDRASRQADKLKAELDHQTHSAAEAKVSLEARVKLLQDELEAASLGAKEHEARALSLQAGLDKLKLDSVTGNSLLNEKLATTLRAKEDTEAQVAGLEAELRSSRSDLHGAQEAIKRLEGEVAGLGHRLEGLESELEDSKGVVNQLEAGKRQAEQTTAAVERERDSLSRDLELTAKKMQDDIDRTSRQADKLKAELDHQTHSAAEAKVSLEARVKLLQDELEAASLGAKEHEARALSLQAGLDKLKLDSVTGNSLLNEKLATTLRAKEDTEAQVAGLEAELRSSRSDLHGAQEAIKRLEGEVAGLGHRLKGLECELEESKGVVNQLEAGKRQAEQTTAAVERERDSLARDLELTAKKMQDDIDRASRQADKLKAELGVSQEKLFSAQRDFSAITAGKDALESSLRTLKEDLLGAQTDARRHDSAARSLQAELTSLKSTSEAQRRELQADLCQSAAALESAEARVASLTLDLRSSEQASLDLEADKQAAQRAAANVECERASLARDLDRATKDLERLRAADAELSHLVTRLKTEVADRSSQEHALQLEADSLRADLDRAKCTVASLQEELTEQHEAQALSNMKHKGLEAALAASHADVQRLHAEQCNLKEVLRQREVDVRAAKEKCQALAVDLDVAHFNTASAGAERDTALSMLQTVTEEAADPAVAGGDRMCAELRQQTEVLKHAQAQLEDLQHVSSALKAEVNAYRQTAEAKIAEAEQLRGELEALSREASDSRGRLEMLLGAASREVEQARGQGRSTQQELDVATSDLLSTKSALSEMESGLTGAQELLTKKEAALNKLHAVNAALSGELDAAGAELQMSKHALQRLEADLQRKSAEHQSVVQSLVAANAESDGLYTDLMSAKSDLHDLDWQMKSDRQSLSQSARSGADRIQRAGSRAWDAAVRSQHLTQLQLDAVLGAATRLAEELSRANASAADSDLVIASLEQELKGRIAANIDLQAGLDKAAEMHRTVKLELAALTHSTAHHQETTATMKADLESTRRELADSQSVASNLRSELADSQLVASKTAAEAKDATRCLDARARDAEQRTASLQLALEAEAEQHRCSVEEVESVKQKSAHMDLAVSRLESELSFADDRIRSLEGRLLAAAEASDLQKAEVAALQANADANTSEAARIISALKGEHEESLRVRETLERRLAEEKEDRKQLDEKMEQAAANMQKSLTASEGTLEESRQRSEDMQAQLTHLTAHAVEMREANARLISEVDLLRSQLESRSLDMDRIGQQLADTRVDLTETTEELKARVRNGQDTEAEIARLEADVNTKQQRIHELKEELAMSEDEIDTLKMQLGAAQDNVRSQELSLVHENAARLGAEKHIQILQGDVELASSRAARLEEELADALSQLEDEVNQARATACRAEEQERTADDLRCKVASLEEDLHQARSGHERLAEQLQAEQEQRQHELDALRHSMASQQEEIASLSTRLSQSDAECGRMASAVELLRRTAGDVSAITSMEKAELESKLGELRAERDATSLKLAEKELEASDSIRGLRKEADDFAAQLIAISGDLALAQDGIGSANHGSSEVQAEMSDMLLGLHKHASQLAQNLAGTQLELESSQNLCMRLRKLTDDCGWETTMAKGLAERQKKQTECLGRELSAARASADSLRADGMHKQTKLAHLESEQERLTAQLTRLKDRAGAENVNAAQREKSLTAELAEARIYEDSLREGLRTETHRGRELESNIRSLRQTLTSSQATIQRLSKQLEAAEVREQEALAAAEEWKSRLQDLEHELKALQINSAEARSHDSRQQETIRRLQSDLKSSEGSVKRGADHKAHLEEQLLEAKSSGHQLKLAIEDLQAGYQRLKEVNEEREESLDRAEEDLKTARSDSNRSKEETMKMKADFEHSSNYAAELQAEAARGREEAEIIRQELEAANYELQQLLRQRGGLEKENVALKCELDALDEAKILAEATIEELDMRHEQALRNLHHLREELATAKRRAASAEEEAARALEATEASDAKAASAWSLTDRERSQLESSKTAMERELAHTQAKLEASDSDRDYLQKKVDELNEELQISKGKMSDAEVASSLAESRVKSLQTDLAKTEESAREAQRQVALTESELKSLRDQVAQLESIQAQLEASLRAAHADCDSFKGQADSQSLEQNRLEARLAQLQGELKMVQAQLEGKGIEMSVQLREHTRLLSEAHAKEATLQLELDEALARSRNVLAEVNQMQRESCASAEELAEAQSLANSLRLKLADSQAQRLKMEAELSDRAVENRETNQFALDLQVELRRATADRENATSLLDDKRMEAVQLAEDLQELTTDAHSKTEALTAAEESLEGYGWRIRELEARVHELLMESEDLTAQAQEARDSERHALRKAVRAEARAALADALQQDLDEARSGADTLSCRVRELQDELEEARSTIADLTRKLEEALGRIAELEALLAAKSEALKAREKEAEAARANAARVQEDMDGMAIASEALEAQMGALEQQIDILGGQLEEKDADQSDLQKQVEHCVAELKHRDAALQDAAETNVRVKASEAAAIAELAEARKRLQVAQLQLANTHGGSDRELAEAHEAYNAMVRQANERLRARDAEIERLNIQLSKAMQQLKVSQSALSQLRQQKTELNASLESAGSTSARSSPAQPRLMAITSSSEDEDSHSLSSRVNAYPEVDNRGNARSSSASGEEAFLLQTASGIDTPGCGSRIASGAAINDLAMLKRKMHAKKAVAIARVHNQAAKETESRASRMGN